MINIRPKIFSFVFLFAMLGCSSAENETSVLQIDVNRFDNQLGLGGKKSIASNSVMSIGSSSTMAGAINSLIWKNKEFINNFDHGRQYQVAWIIDGDDLGPCGECRNPTEAGGRYDGYWDKPSSSRLEALKISGNVFESTSYPAYWMKPGELWKPHTPLPAKNLTVVSDYLLSKRVQLGFGGVENAIQFDITINSPRPHTVLQIEAPTAYLNKEFNKIYIFDYETNTLTDMGHEYFDRPDVKSVIIATEDGQYAMGAWAPSQDNEFSVHYAAGYFKPETNDNSRDFATSKWTIPMRGRNISAGNISFRSYQFVGTLEDVKSSMVRVVSMVTGEDIETPTPTATPGDITVAQVTPAPVKNDKKCKIKSAQNKVIFEESGLTRSECKEMCAQNSEKNSEVKCRWDGSKIKIDDSGKTKKAEEKAEKERKKEQERKRKAQEKEEKAKKKADEKAEKERKKEQERKRKAQEKEEKAKKKADEKAEKERKKEQELKRKSQEKEEKAKKKAEEKAERERKKDEDRRKKDEQKRQKKSDAREKRK